MLQNLKKMMRMYPALQSLPARRKCNRKYEVLKNQNQLMIRIMKISGAVENAAINGMTIVQIIGLFVIKSNRIKYLFLFTSLLWSY